MQETLFDGVVNPISFQLLDARSISQVNPLGEPIPFEDNGIKRMDLNIGTEVITSADGIGNITWDNVGNVHITSGEGVGSITRDILHSTSLIVYDNIEGNNGTLMVDPRMEYSNLRIEVVDL